jgi:hypothetical protein
VIVIVRESVRVSERERERERPRTDLKWFIVPSILLERGLHVEVAVDEKGLLLGVGAKDAHQNGRKSEENKE